MSVSSSGRRELLRAAAAATFHVLNALAPEPLVTAAALAERPKRTKQADPMRLTLSEPKAVGKPQLLDLIAKSELARELVYSYVCAAQRKEPWAVKAQILSPFTAQYSLRLFNESFEPQLRECGPVKRYGWWFAKWHGAIWLAGQSAAKSSTQRWRLKGAGDLATLPHAKIVLAVEFLCSLLSSCSTWHSAHDESRRAQAGLSSQIHSVLSAPRRSGSCTRRAPCIYQAQSRPLTLP